MVRSETAPPAWSLCSWPIQIILHEGTTNCAMNCWCSLYLEPLLSPEPAESAKPISVSEHAAVGARILKLAESFGLIRSDIGTKSAPCQNRRTGVSPLAGFNRSRLLLESDLCTINLRLQDSLKNYCILVKDGSMLLPRNMRLCLCKGMPGRHLLNKLSMHRSETKRKYIPGDGPELAWVSSTRFEPP